MKEWFEVVFYDGNGSYPAYYLIDRFECETLEEVLKDKLEDIIRRIREMFRIERDVPNWKIYKTLYVFKVDGLVQIVSVT
jgi:hypothetical protein